MPIFRLKRRTQAPWDSGFRLIEAPSAEIVNAFLNSLIVDGPRQQSAFEIVGEFSDVHRHGHLDLMLDEEGKVIYENSFHRQAYRHWLRAESQDKFHEYRMQDGNTVTYRGIFGYGPDFKLDTETICCTEKQGSSFPVDLKDSLKLANHSPDGFAWGYHGSGPAQAALAVLFDYTRNVDVSLMYYQEFKNDFIAQFPKDKPWEIEEKVLRDWLTKKAGVSSIVQEDEEDAQRSLRSIVRQSEPAKGKMKLCDVKLGERFREVGSTDRQSKFMKIRPIYTLTEGTIIKTVTQTSPETGVLKRTYNREGVTMEPVHAGSLIGNVLNLVTLIVGVLPDDTEVEYL